MRRIGYLAPAILMLVIALGAAPKPSLASQNHPMHSTVQTVRAQAANVVIHLSGSLTAWNGSTTPNPTITVNQGSMVSISLTSSDGISHLFLLDIDKDSVSDTADCPTVDPCSAAFPPNTSISFTASTPGTYTYYCIFHPASMIGSFVISSAPSTGGGGGGHPYEA